MSDKSLQLRGAATDAPDGTDPYATSDRPAARSDGLPAPFLKEEITGTMIGPYKLLQLLGEGGMGSVWMAEQNEPVKRRVAVKIPDGAAGGSTAVKRPTISGRRPLPCPTNPSACRHGFAPAPFGCTTNTAFCAA